MAIRPKDRFEAFKRDGFTCQYCGRKAPVVILEADHVISIAEGGGDELENLVTACWECNRGKGPRGLDARAPVVDIAEQTELIAERAAQLAVYNDAKRAEREARDAAFNRVRNYWFEVWHEETLEHYYMPWENSLRHAIDKLGEEEVMDAMRTAAGRFGYVTANAVRYFGGVVKRKIAEQEGRVTDCTICGKRIILTPEQARENAEGWHHTGCGQPTAES